MSAVTDFDLNDTVSADELHNSDEFWWDFLTAEYNKVDDSLIEHRKRKAEARKYWETIKSGGKS